jgi:hypothetical protein
VEPPDQRAGHQHQLSGGQGPTGKPWAQRLLYLQGVNHLNLEARMARLRRYQEGKAGWILLWLLGVPIPVLFVLFLLRGCT